MLSSVRPPRGTGHSPLGLTVSPGLAVPASKAFSQACPRTKSGPVSGTCVWPLNPAGSDLIGETRGGAWGAPAPGERVKDSLCLRFKHQSSDQRAVGPGLPPLQGSECTELRFISDLPARETQGDAPCLCGVRGHRAAPRHAGEAVSMGCLSPVSAPKAPGHSEWPRGPCSHPASQDRDGQEAGACARRACPLSTLCRPRAGTSASGF